MSQFRLLPRAARDLNEIADYTLAQWGARQLEDYMKQIDKRFRVLAANPLLGRARDELGAGVRSFPHARHVIFYVEESGEIHIIGVVHAAMDLDAYFGEGGP